MESMKELALPTLDNITVPDVGMETSKCPFSHLWQRDQGSGEFAPPEAEFHPRLYQPEDIEQESPPDGLSPEDHEACRNTLTWTREFIARPHPKLGRTGAICPFVSPSLRENMLYISVCRLQMPTDMMEIYHKVMTYKDIMLALEPTTGELAKLKTILIVLPDVPEAAAEWLMEPLHKRLKTELLEEDLMIGQFYATCKIPATHNPDFMPLQSPVPMFVIRTFIETDWRFLQGNPTWEQTYMSRFNR